MAAHDQNNLSTGISNNLQSTTSIFTGRDLPSGDLLLRVASAQLFRLIASEQMPLPLVPLVPLVPCGFKELLHKNQSDAGEMKATVLRLTPTDT